MTKWIVLLITVAFTVALASCGDGSASNADGPTIPDIIVPGDPLAGVGPYKTSCSSCHGEDLKGVEGLGNTLAPSVFVASTSEHDLVLMTITGRPSDHPDNSTGLAMLPRGGNPSLSDQTIHDIAAYLKAHN